MSAVPVSTPPRRSAGKTIAAVTSPPLNASKSVLLLSAEELRQTPDNRLLAYLMDAYNTVRGIATPAHALTPTTTTSAAGGTVSPFTPAFVEELLTPRLLGSAIPDVSQLVASLLCDAVRLHHHQLQQQHHRRDALHASPGTSGGTSLNSPFDTSSDTAAPVHQSNSTSFFSDSTEIQKEQDANLPAAETASLPFSVARCPEVLHAIANVFASLQPPAHSTPSPSAASSYPSPLLPLKRAACLIERAAAAHIFSHLLPHCPLSSADTQQALQCIFDAVRCASSTASAATTGNGLSVAATAATTSTATCAEMAQLLLNIVNTTHGITSSQLTPLLEELAAHSAALEQNRLLKLRVNLSRSNSSSSSSTMPPAGRSAQLHDGALVAARVLSASTEVLWQPAIAAWALSEFEAGVEEVMVGDDQDLQLDLDATETTKNERGEAEDEEQQDLWVGEEGGDEEDGDGPRAAAAESPLLPLLKREKKALPFKVSRGNEARLAHRRRGLHKVAHVLEILVALTALQVDLVDTILPQIALSLDHPNADIRLLLVRGFGAIFAANDVSLVAYAALFDESVLPRFADVKPNIRMEALRMATMLLAARGLCSSQHNIAGPRQQQRQLWHAFQPCWERLLTDPHVLVRKQAVVSLTEAALAVPQLFATAPLDTVDIDFSIATPDAMSTAIPSSSSLPSSSPHASSWVPAAADGRAAFEGSPSRFLAQTLGLRTRDKNKRVRDAAVAGLAALYALYCLPWIPNAVLDTTRVEASSGGGSSTGATATSVWSVMECVLERLLPSPSSTTNDRVVVGAAAATSGGSGGARGSQATLTWWLHASATSVSTSEDASSGAAAVTTMPAGTKPKNFALFDFEQDDCEPRAPGPTASETTEEEGDVLLGFAGRSTEAEAPNSKRAPGTVHYVSRLIQLCQDVDAPHFLQLLRIHERKPQLRLAIRKLFEYHAAVKASHGDVKSPEGQQRLHAIHRLLKFLQETTGAQKGEWEGLFRAKDEGVRKALVRACDPAQKNWTECREVLIRSLHGRVSSDESAFVQQLLAPQLIFSVRPAHVTELMRSLRRSIYVSARAEVLVDTPEAVGVLRALRLVMAAAPSLSSLIAAGLAEAVQAAAKQSLGPPPVWCALLLQTVQQWATASVEGSSASSEETTTVDTLEGVVTSEQKEQLVGTLRAMALAGLPMQHVSTTVAPENTRGSSGKKNRSSARASAVVRTEAPLRSLKQLAKQATRTLLALLQLPGFASIAATALQTLVTALTHELTNGRALTNDVKTIAWLASVRALATHSKVAAALHVSTIEAAVAPKDSKKGGDNVVPALLPHLGTLLVAAVLDTSDAAEQTKLLKANGATSSSAAVPVLATAEHTGSVASSTSASSLRDHDTAAATTIAATTTATQLAAPLSVAAAIVDGAAKALTALALSCPMARNCRAASVSCALDALLQSYKSLSNATAVTRGGGGGAGPSTIGSAQRRLALEKQLVKLLLTPTSDLAMELAASVVLSVEEEAAVRHIIQAKLAAHLLHKSCDMRFASLLLLTAISEDTKQSYQRLRTLTEAVGDHLRAKQTSQGVSLSSPQALYCYWEYTIPFLVLFLAHHPYFGIEESDHHFMNFQRVWHLLVGELFRSGTQCAGFVVELLSKIKQSDDALDPSSDAARVMCDLGSRVLLECLGQRQSRAEDLRRYPGVILLPSFFVKTAVASPQKLLDTSYLSDAVRVTPNAPFRLAAVTNPAAGASRSNSASVRESRATSPQATPRASSTLHGMPLDEKEAKKESSRPSASPAQSPSTQRKRSRTALQRQRPSLSAEMDDDNADAVSPDVSLSPSQPRPQMEVFVDAPASKREKTEPTVADSAEASTSWGTATPVESPGGSVVHSEQEAQKRTARQRAAVDETLHDLFRGLSKPKIAQLRWKEVRGRLEAALEKSETMHHTGYQPVKELEAPPLTPTLERDLEGLLTYAKEQLRVWYDRAPVQ